MFPTSYGQALNNAGYQQSINGYFNGNRYDPSAAYAAQQGSMQNAQNAYDANQQRLAAEAAWQAQQQAAAPATYSNRVELEKELAYNENEIRYLQNQLETMRAEWMDQDSFDRKLAANRAAIGDFGNARAHQNDIIARQNDRNRLADTAMQWRWQAKQNEIARQADKEKQAKAEIKRIIGEIEDIDTARPYHTDLGAKNALDTKRARLVRELAAYGVSAPVVNQGQGQGSDSVATLVQDEAAATDKNGHFIDADKKKDIHDRYKKLGLEAEAKRVMNTLTAPEAKAKNEKVKAEKEDARKLVNKYQNMTEVQRMSFSTRWNANDPNDKEIQLLRKYATFDGSAPKMR